MAGNACHNLLEQLLASATLQPAAFAQWACQLLHHRDSNNPTDLNGTSAAPPVSGQHNSKLAAAAALQLRTQTETLQEALSLFTSSFSIEPTAAGECSGSSCQYRAPLQLE